MTFLIKNVMYVGEENLKNKDVQRKEKKNTSQIIPYWEINTDSITVFIFLLVKVEL